MKIGIEAKWYFEGPPSGRRVVRSLVDHISKLDDEHEYYIFLDRKSRGKELLHGRNVHLIYVWAGNNFLSNVFLLPFYSLHLKLDALLYQNFVSPFDRAKRVAYIHDVLFLSNPEYYTVFERLYFAPLKFLTSRSHLIITVSEEEKKRLLKYGFSKHQEKVIVAHHGVDPGFQPLENYGEQVLQQIKQKFKLPESFLLYVGRLNLRKNLGNLLKAIPLLKDQTIPLVIVGADDWKRSDHQEVIKSLGIANRIHFTGAIHQELPAVYALANIFCFPSFAESFGLPPLEAMASGVPVVVSNTTSLPEVCGPAGVYVTPDNPGEIAGAIDKLMNDKRFYDEMVKEGLKQASKFSWQQAVRIIVREIVSLPKK